MLNARKLSDESDEISLFGCKIRNTLPVSPTTTKGGRMKEKMTEDQVPVQVR